MNSDRVEGKVKWFNDKKGYGFLIADNIPGDIFIHYTQIRTSDSYKTLSEGQVVDFRVAVTAKGTQAEDVRRR